LTLDPSIPAFQALNAINEAKYGLINYMPLQQLNIQKALAQLLDISISETPFL
jgi:hypothetical protein